MKTAKRKPPADLAKAIKALQDRCDEQRFDLERAAGLLAVLAEACQENNHRNSDEAWFQAEYLAKQMARHTEELGRVSEDLDRLSMGIGSDEPPTDGLPALRVVSPTEGDAA